MRLYEQMAPSWLEDPDAHLDEIRRFCTRHITEVPDQWDEPSDPWDELSAILHRLSDLENRTGRPPLFVNHDSPTEDFGPAREGLTDEEVAAIVLKEREPVRREIAGLRILFVELCAALRRTSPWRLTSGQRSRLTCTIHELEDQAELARALGEISAAPEEKVSTLPTGTTIRGRASETRASELHEKLTQEGRVSCSLDEFLAWLGPCFTSRPIVPEKPLEWLESDERKREKQIALFIVDYAHAVRAIQGTVAGSGKRELPTKAICAAFGITDRQQIERIGRRARRENNKRDSNKPSKTQ